MPDLPTITCPEHNLPLLPGDFGLLRCPQPGCLFPLAQPAPPLSSPLTFLEQGAAQHHELVRAHEAAGFSRTEAMQVLCCVISASIMKGSGSG